MVLRHTPIHQMGGIHEYRGGLVPQEETVKYLGVWLLDNGFLEAEANHQGVCVEDIPADERPRGTPGLAEYNREKTKNTSYLGACFTDARPIHVGT